LTADGAISSINNKYYTGGTIYIRAVNIERDGEQYGTYYQAVRSYREQGKVKQEVIHLGEHQTADEALTAWQREIGALETTRPKQARKLQAKLDRLGELT
jgi:CTP synthase (UTP-ammonia lyase)